MDQPELLQFTEALDVDRAPVAARLARTEPYRVAGIVDASAHAVDPAETERLVNRLRPGDAGLARTLLVEPDQELGSPGVIGLQPGAKLGRSSEERRPHGGRS